MLEQFVLGLIQGVAEWLPVSSEGMLVLAQTAFFDPSGNFESAVKAALFLHLGTFLAALIYFRKDVADLIRALFRFRSQPAAIQNLTVFLLISTLISGILGLGLLVSVTRMTQNLETPGKIVTLMIGLLLLATAFLELRAKRDGYRTLENLTLRDGILLGITQGFAALPGFSRSGLTVSALLLLKFDKKYALKISFLMSLPIVLAGNIILNITDTEWKLISLVGLLFSFLFGLLSIHLLLKVAERVNFGYFVGVFAILTICTALFIHTPETSSASSNPDGNAVSQTLVTDVNLAVKV